MERSAFRLAKTDFWLDSRCAIDVMLVRYAQKCEALAEAHDECNRKASQSIEFAGQFGFLSASAKVARFAKLIFGFRSATCKWPKGKSCSELKLAQSRTNFSALIT